MRYPYIVVRVIPAVYFNNNIIFGAQDDRFTINEGITLNMQKEEDESGNLTKNCVEQIVQKLVMFSKVRRFRMCLVLGEKKCIYVEPDGDFSFCEDKPSSNIDLNFIPEDL